MDPIGVMLVEDSLTVRRFLEHLIDGDPRLRVVASVDSGERALECLERSAPDVLSVDITLPGMDGFEVVRRVMERRPTPVVVCSSSVRREELAVSMNALRAGALTVVEKPAGTASPDFERLARELCTQLAIMSQVRVVRRRPARPDPPSEVPRTEGRRSPAPRGAVPALRAIGLVASTGGPPVLVDLLGRLGSPAVPILLVQHIAPPFHDGFVRWLDDQLPLRVGTATAGPLPRDGVHVAPPERHLTVTSGRLELSDEPPLLHQRPSGTLLLRSLAEGLGGCAAGVVLTGMGEDGADGLLALRRAGAPTFAQDRDTCAVYGMPFAAAERGAAASVLSPAGIASALRRLAAPQGEDG